jgi:hypothetical protein
VPSKELSAFLDSCCFMSFGQVVTFLILYGFSFKSFLTIFETKYAIHRALWPFHDLTSETLPHFLNHLHGSHSAFFLGLHLTGLFIPFWSSRWIEVCRYVVTFFMQFQNQNTSCVHRCCAKTIFFFARETFFFCEQACVNARNENNWEISCYFVSFWKRETVNTAHPVQYYQWRILLIFIERDQQSICFVDFHEAN